MAPSHHLLPGSRNIRPPECIHRCQGVSAAVSAASLSLVTCSLLSTNAVMTRPETGRTHTSLLALQWRVSPYLEASHMLKLTSAHVCFAGEPSENVVVSTSGTCRM